MSYAFDDFRARFDAQGIKEDVAREQFELIDQIMDAFVCWAWGDDPVEDALGINQLIDSKCLSEGVKSNIPLLEPYNEAAQNQQEGKEHDSQNTTK